MEIREQELIDILSGAKRAVLLEPDYETKFLPLGLAKIATLIKKNGGAVSYQKRYIPSEDNIVCITSLFTYESQTVIDAISQVLFLNPSAAVLVGGIYATLMSNDLEKRFGDRIKIFRGYSKILDSTPPDYKLAPGLKDEWGQSSLIFTTRGCPNSCAYCAVKKLEPDSWINPNWKNHIAPDLPYVIIFDNNLTAYPREHVLDVLKFLRESGKEVMFENGLDCKTITPEYAKEIASLKYFRDGLRVAFDRIEEDGTFQGAVKMLLDAGAQPSDFMAYVLYNFNDTPQEAEYRFNEVVKLGLRPYPQCYISLNCTTRGKGTSGYFTGKHWTPALKRNFRYFYLMAGCYNHYKMEDWLKLRDKNAEPMSEEDWKKYHYKKEV